MQDHHHPDIIALALGSNLGDRLQALRAAITAIAPFFTVQKKSAIYETPAAYVADQPSFLNAALTGISALPPPELLQALKRIERELGRHESFRNGPRLIDIDIVFYGARRIATPELTLPHPRMMEREFVLRPLADIAGDWRYPETSRTIQTMLAALPTAEARRLTEPL